MQHQNPLLASVQVALQKGTQLDAVRLIDEVVDFCLKHENGKVLGNWEEDAIKVLVAYHWAKGTLNVLRDEDGVHGVHMWYNCNEDDDWSFIQNWIQDREDGDSIFMAFLFADCTESFKKLTGLFIESCPDIWTKKLLGIRYRSGFPQRVTYEPKLFKKILELKAA